MQIKAHYGIIPALIILTLWLGSVLTRSGLGWYHTELVLSSLTPPDWVFPIAWNIIAVGVALSLFLFWRFKRDASFALILFLFVVNGILNVAWSYAFFVRHNLAAAFGISAALELTIVALMLLLWKDSKAAALFLLPYALWVLFATYLTWDIWLINMPI